MRRPDVISYEPVPLSAADQAGFRCTLPECVNTLVGCARLDVLRAEAAAQHALSPPDRRRQRIAAARAAQRQQAAR